MLELAAHTACVLRSWSMGECASQYAPVVERTEAYDLGVQPHCMCVCHGTGGMQVNALHALRLCVAVCVSGSGAGWSEV